LSIDSVEVTEYYFSRMYRLVLDSIQSPIQGVSQASSLGVNWPGREIDHSPPSSVEVQNALGYIVASLIFFKEVHRSKSTFTFVVL
jgi:hypothetical protein